MKPFRHVGDVDPNRAVEIVMPLSLHVELPSAAPGHAVRKPADADFKIRFTRSNRQGVFKVLALESAHVRHPHQVVAMGGRGKRQLGVLAEAPPAFVVVLEVDREGRQAV